MKNTKAEKVKNSSSHAEFISASIPNIMMLNKEEILNQVQDDNRRGFTLIELLVVVLIIGILAAVALPQYQKAVLKSRLTQGLVYVKAVKDAEEIFYLANGEYTDNMEELDVEAVCPQGWSCAINLALSKVDAALPEHIQVTYSFDKRPETGWAGVLHCSAWKSDPVAVSLCTGMGNKDMGETEATVKYKLN